VSKNASDPITGSITTRISNEQDSIRDYTKQIADFEDRMTLRQQTLQTQYAALETMLGKLQSQSQWLTGQLASLPSTSSSK
jgi:flagellar hook-associated protein 2